MKQTYRPTARVELPKGETSKTHLEVSAYYDKGGMNFSQSVNEKRGIWVSVTPVESEGGFYKRTPVGDYGEAGFKVFIKSLGRSSHQRVNKVFDLVEENLTDIVSMFSKGEYAKVYELLKTFEEKV